MGALNPIKGHAHFSSGCNFMVDLGKPQLLAKFEVAGFMYYGNIQESVSKRQIRFEPPFGGVRGNVQTSPIAC